MDKMQVLVAVPEAGQSGSLGGKKNIEFMAGETQVIVCVGIGGIKTSGVVTDQHPEFFAAVSVVAGGAIAIFYGTMLHVAGLQKAFEIGHGLP